MIRFKYKPHLKEKNSLNIILISMSVNLYRRETLLDGVMSYLFRNLLGYL